MEPAAPAAAPAPAPSASAATKDCITYGGGLIASTVATARCELDGGSPRRAWQRMETVLDESDQHAFDTLMGAMAKPCVVDPLLTANHPENEKCARQLGLIPPQPRDAPASEKPSALRAAIRARFVTLRFVGVGAAVELSAMADGEPLFPESKRSISTLIDPGHHDARVRIVDRRGGSREVRVAIDAEPGSCQKLVFDGTNEPARERCAEPAKTDNVAVGPVDPALGCNVPLRGYADTVADVARCELLHKSRRGAARLRNGIHRAPANAETKRLDSLVEQVLRDTQGDLAGIGLRAPEGVAGLTVAVDDNFVGVNQRVLVGAGRHLVRAWGRDASGGTLVFRQELDVASGACESAALRFGAGAPEPGLTSTCGDGPLPLLGEKKVSTR